MKHHPQRTCIGCRQVFQKNDLVRIVAGPVGPVIDYREKMPGRAAYVCPRQECVEKAVSRENLSKALHLKVKVPSAESFTARLAETIKVKIISLMSMAVKAGRLAAGYSAVLDAIEKGRAEMIVYAGDVSTGTREKIAAEAGAIPHETLFTRDELGKAFNRELIGVVALEDKAFANEIRKQTQRLKSLINISG